MLAAKGGGPRVALEHGSVERRPAGTAARGSSRDRKPQLRAKVGLRHLPVTLAWTLPLCLAPKAPRVAWREHLSQPALFPSQLRRPTVYIARHERAGHPQCIQVGRQLQHAGHQLHVAQRLRLHLCNCCVRRPLLLSRPAGDDVQDVACRLCVRASGKGDHHVQTALPWPGLLSLKPSAAGCPPTV